MVTVIESRGTADLRMRVSVFGKGDVAALFPWIVQSIVEISFAPVHLPGYGEEYFRRFFAPSPTGEFTTGEYLRDEVNNR